jgi:hypothetical protein
MNRFAQFGSVTVTFLCLVSGVSSVFAQTQASTPSPMPTDPAAFIAAAAPLNGLDAPDMKPWHIKVNYQTFALDGKPDDEGTFEEWWAAPDKDKIVYAGTKFHRTLYITHSGAYQVGDSGVLPPALFFARQAIVYPGIKSVQADVVYRAGPNPFKGSDLACVDAVLARDKGDDRNFITDKYCFNAGTAVLRTHVTSGLVDTVYQHMTTLDTQNVAEEISTRIQGKTYLTLKLVEGGALKSISDADFEPPSDAAKVETTQTLERSEGMQVRRTSSSPPHFPIQAMQLRMHLVANLAVLVGADGHVKQARPLSQPSAITDAAIEAVKSWTYGSTAADQPLTETWLMVDLALN